MHSAKNSEFATILQRTRQGAFSEGRKRLHWKGILEPRARVELATCRLRIGCSTTELPRLRTENYISIRGKLLSIYQRIGRSFSRLQMTAKCLRILTRERVHGPADPDTEQQKEQQRPRNIFYAIHWAAPAQEAERDGYQEREQQHGLQVAQVKLHLGLSLPAARSFISVQRCQQIEHSSSS